MSLLKLPESPSPIGKVLQYNRDKHWNEGYVDVNLDVLPSNKSNIFAENLYVLAKKHPKYYGFLLQPYVNGKPINLYGKNLLQTLPRI